MCMGTRMDVARFFVPVGVDRRDLEHHSLATCIPSKQHTCLPVDIGTASAIAYVVIQNI